MIDRRKLRELAEAASPAVVLELLELQTRARKALSAAHHALGACSCPHPRHQDEHGDPTCCGECAAAEVVIALSWLIDHEARHG